MRTVAFAAVALVLLCAASVAADAVTAQPPTPLSVGTVVKSSTANTNTEKNVGDGIDSSASAALKDLGDDLGKIILIILGISLAVCVCGVLITVVLCCGGIACIAKLCSDEQRNQQQLQQQQYQQQTAYVAVQPGQYPQAQQVPGGYAPQAYAPQPQVYQQQPAVPHQAQHAPQYHPPQQHQQPQQGIYYAPQGQEPQTV